MEENKDKLFYVFSDESGSWHDESDLYVRAWVAINKKEYDEKLVPKLNEIASSVCDAKELKWSNFTNSENHFSEFNDINFYIFITITAPKDIDWKRKYNVTKNFDYSMNDFDFGEIDADLIDLLKDRIFRDIKNILFLKYYEKLHIENAIKGIERALQSFDYTLKYEIDPPQMPRKIWEKVLSDVGGENIRLRFGDSTKTKGIQFADLFAGAMRSFLIMDDKKEQAKLFLSEYKNKLISKNKGNPNPNLIMFDETNEELKNKSGEIWYI